FVGVVEAHALQSDLTLLSLAVDDDLQTCDGDGVIDHGETGSVRVELQNRGMLAMAPGSVLEVLNPDPALSFPAGATLELGALGPLEKTTLAIELALAPDVAPDIEFIEPITLDVRLTTPGGCGSERQLSVPTVLNGDVKPGASTL